MELTQLLNSVHAIQVAGEVQRKDVAGIFYDSRKVVKNSVFVAIKGYLADGHKFILDAINKGAIAIVLEDNTSVPDDIFIHQSVGKILVKDSRKALAEISGCFYNYPSKKLKLIGVTGTNGKTTTTYFIKNIFESAGIKAGVVGTIGSYIGDKPLVLKGTPLTTPEINDMNEMLLEMVNEGCGAAVMEVSSHSLILHRVDGLSFAAGAFTNITSDHLDFHGTFENYFSAKKILFESLPEGSFAIYNADDKNGRVIVTGTKGKVFSYGTMSDADFRISNIKYDLNGTTFIIKYKGQDYNTTTSLIGEFNAFNACAAFASTVLLGISEDAAVKGIKSSPQVPGRMEVIGSYNKKVIVDYSHTADSLEKALLTIRKIAGSSIPVYTVFGCGGNRDRTKRPVMGKIAAELSTKAIITSDNPRYEDPLEIINEIRKGITKNNFEIIENREEAIKSVIKNSEDNAVILIAGKGHENYQEIKGVRNHFSDKETALKYLNSL